jgi:hypothetical protein
MSYRLAAICPLFCLAVALYVSAVEMDDPLLQLEHGIRLEEIQRRHVDAMIFYHNVLAEPTAGARIGAEARLHLARCYEWRDSPSAAISLYQSLVRNHPEATSHVRYANERLSMLAAEVSVMPDFPSRHLAAHLNDLLRMLAVSIKRPQHPLTPLLIEQIRNVIQSAEDEVKLAPGNETSDFRNKRRHLQGQFNGQRAALATALGSQASGLQETAIRAITSDASFSSIRSYEDLFPSANTFGRLLLEARGDWIASVIAESTDAVRSSSDRYRQLLQPLSEGPSGNTEVQAAQALLITLDRVTSKTAVNDWSNSGTLLLRELISVHSAFKHAPKLEVPKADSLDTLQTARLAGILTPVKEAVVALNKQQRPELIYEHLDAVLVNGQRLVLGWQEAPLASQRVQSLLNNVKRARALVVSDPGGCIALLQPELYR